MIHLTKISNFFKKPIIKNYLIVFVFILALEITFKLINGWIVFSASVVRLILFSNLIALIVTFGCSFLSEKKSRIVIMVFTSLISLYSLIQIGLYNFLGTYISLNTGAQFNKVKTYVLDFLKSFMWHFFLILIPLLILIVFYIVRNHYEKKKNKDNINVKKITDKTFKFEKLIRIKWRLGLILFLIVSLVAFQYSLIAPFLQNKYQYYSNAELYKYPKVQSLAVNQFGIIGYSFIDFKTVLIGEGITVEKKVDFKNDNQEVAETLGIDDSNWEKVAKKEKNITYQKLNNYFINQEFSLPNEMTGIFKDKNLIVIMLESVGSVILDYPEYFPTINKLKEEGFNFTNNYSPRNSCATGNNEMTIMTSLFSINNTCTTQSFKDNKYFQSIFNIFKNEGYKTSSYHNYNDYFYNRTISHKNMGSEAYYDINTIEPDYTPSMIEWPSDVTLMKEASKRFIDKDKFMAFITTVTPHQPYITSSTYGNKHLELFDDLDIAKSVKRYLSKLKETDLALEELLNNLKENNKLNDTVIVITSDHYPYALSNKSLEKIYKNEININNEIDRTPFIIYNAKTKGREINKYTTLMNILPTVANMFDVEHDSRLYIGKDIFNPEYEDISVFNDGSWQTSKAFYNATTGELDYVSDKEYTDEEILEINELIYYKLNASHEAIRSNYFKYLEDEIK